MIYEEVLKKLLTFISESSISCVRDAVILLKDGSKVTEIASESPSNFIERAQFALGVLGGSFYGLRLLSEQSELPSSIIAVLFIIGWESRMLMMMNSADAELEENIKFRSDFGEQVLSFNIKISKNFWNSLNTYNREQVGSVLTKFIRSAIVMRDNIDTSKITSLCCQWLLEVFEYFCQNGSEEQILLDQLLSKDDKWPLWVVESTSFRVEKVCIIICLN